MNLNINMPGQQGTYGNQGGFGFPSNGSRCGSMGGQQGPGQMMQMMMQLMMQMMQMMQGQMGGQQGGGCQCCGGGGQGFNPMMNSQQRMGGFGF